MSADVGSRWSRAASWVERALCENGEPSTARVLTCYLYMLSSLWISGFFYAHGDFPDASKILAIATYSSSPYACRQIGFAIAQRTGNAPPNTGT